MSQGTHADEVQSQDAHAESKPQLAFDESAAPADSRMAGRRLILKLGAAGTAALVAGAGSAEAAVAAAAQATPIPLPYSRKLTLNASPAVLADRSGKQGDYEFTGSGILTIDAAGEARLSNISATGGFKGGTLDVGPISIVSDAGDSSGKYVRGKIFASAPVLFSDGTFGNQPAQVSLSGSLAANTEDLLLSTSFRDDEPTPTITIWSRSF